MKIIYLTEMANLSSDRTGLPYDIWLDSSGNGRNTSHNLPRLKIDIEGDKIPVSISKEPKILVKRKEIPKFRLFKKFMMLNYDNLIKHWNQEIDDEFLKRNIKKVD